MAFLKPIAYPPRVVARRKSLSRMLEGEIIQRDGFHCRYCTGRVIPTPIMQASRRHLPRDIPVPTANWQAGVTHPAIAARSPAIDHVKPVAHGGALVDPANLATACYPCNPIKADFTLEQPCLGL